MVSARRLAPGGFLPEFIAPRGQLSGEGSPRLYRLVGEMEAGKNLVRGPAGGQWLGCTSHRSFPSRWVLLIGSSCLRDGKGPDVVFFQLPILEGTPSVASLADGHIASAFTLGEGAPPPPTQTPHSPLRFCWQKVSSSPCHVSRFPFLLLRMRSRGSLFLTSIASPKDCKALEARGGSFLAHRVAQRAAH